MSTTTVLTASPSAPERVYYASERLLDAIDARNERPGVETFDIDGRDGDVLAAAFLDAGWPLDAAGRFMPELRCWSSDRERAAREADASRISRPWETLREVAGDAAHDLKRVLRDHLDLALDLPASGSTQRIPSDARGELWLLRDFITARKINLLTGRRGALKSGTWLAQVAASLNGTPFLGRDVLSARWMVLSGEQDANELSAAFDAYGVPDDGLHWTPRDAGVRLGEPRWAAWLRREVEAFRPDVLVIDSVSTVCDGVSVLDNDSVIALHRNTLRPLIDDLGLTVLLIHHHNKGGGTLGATAWETQADFVLSVTPTGKREDTVNADGTINTRQTFAYARTKTSRAVASEKPEHIEVRGHVAANGWTDRMELHAPTREPTTAERVLAALDGGPLGRGALAKAIDLDATGSAFRKALNSLVEAGQVTQNDDGLYERVTA